MSVLTVIPSAVGDYVLVVRFTGVLQLEVGGLGTLQIPPGWGLYIGSAHGPGGLRARIHRHLRPPHLKKPHWHIDYVAAVAPVQEVWWHESQKRLECLWADSLNQIGKVMPGFGSSDCRCPSHFVLCEAVSQVNQARKQISDLCHGKFDRARIAWKEVR